MQILKSILLAIAVLTCLAPQEAAAKRGSGFFRIPTGETVVMVKDLRNIEQLRRADGTYVDLGYHYKTLFGGEWVGYVGSSSEYLALKPESLNVLLALGGLSELPPVPSRPFTASILFYLMIASGVLVLLAKFGILRKKSPRGYANSSSSEPSATLNAKMMEAVEQYKQVAPNSSRQFGKRS
jgi:hypothetical protein